MPPKCQKSSDPSAWAVEKRATTNQSLWNKLPTVLSPVWFLPGAQRWWVWKSQRSVAESEAEVLVTGRLSLGPCWLFWQKYLTKQRSWHSPDPGRMVNEDPPRGVMVNPHSVWGSTSTLRRHHTQRKLESRKHTEAFTESALPFPALLWRKGRSRGLDSIKFSPFTNILWARLEGKPGGERKAEREKSVWRAGLKARLTSTVSLTSRPP